MKRAVTLLLSCTLFLAANSSAFAAAIPNILPVTLGLASRGTIDLPGQQDRFTFSGVIGQRLYFDTLDYDSENITTVLYAPSGVVVFIVGHSSDHGPFHLLESGIHTLVIDGTADATGDYSFRLLDLNEAIPLTFGVTISNQLNPRNQSLAYQFNGVAGQRIVATSISATYHTANWRLVGPEGQILFSANIFSSPGEILLPHTGTYVLLFEGQTEGVTPLNFQALMTLASNPLGTPTGFGVERKGSTIVGMTNSYTYIAPAGLVGYFDALTNSSAAEFQLLSPNGVPVFDVVPAADAGFFFLPMNGTYTLNVIGVNEGDYHFRLLDLSSASSTTTSNLAFGVTYARTLSTPFRTDVYRFTASPGQILFYDSMEDDSDAVTTRIHFSNGALVFSSSSPHYPEGPYRFVVPGTYYLAIESQSADDTNDYRFRLIDPSQAPTQPLALDVPVSGLLNPGTAANLYSFTAAAGHLFYFDGSVTNAAGYWYLYDPAGVHVSGAGLSGDFLYRTTIAGTYIVAVANSGFSPEPVPYSIRVRSTTTNSFPLVLGTPVNGALSVLGQEDWYSFIGSAGQKLFYDALDNNGDSLNAQFISPNGTTFQSGSGAESDFGPLTLPQSGTYRMVLRGNGEATGTYSFRLIDLAQPPVQALALNGPVQGLLNPGTAVNFYRIAANAGQRLYFDGAGTNAGGVWTLYGPAGQPITGNSLAGDFEHTPAVTGTHFLAFSGTGTSPIPYSVRVVAPVTTVLPYTLGATAADTLAVSGEERHYVFTGTAGQRLYYDALDSDFDAITVTLIDSASETVHLDRNSDSDFGLFTLRQSGLHKLVVRGADTVGDYRFRLLDIADAPLITYGVTVTNRLDPQNEADLFRISGLAGQRISITNLAVSSGNASWSLLSPNNTVLLNQNIAVSLGEYTLPTSGTYALVLAGVSDFIGALEYRFRVSLLSSSNGLSSGFGLVRSGVTITDQTNTFAYQAPAGTLVYFDALTANYAANVQLVDPNGGTVFHINGYYDQGPFSLPTNGNYLVNVIGVGAGDYNFRLLNLAVDSIPLTFGTAYSQTNSPIYRTGAYQFSGTNGLRVLYDSLLYDLQSINLRLYTPSGVNANLTGMSGNDFAPLTINEPGTYYLLIENQSVDVGTEYRFRVVAADQPPTTTLAFDTPINGNLNPGTRNDVYRFLGVAGQRLYFDALPNNGNGSWVLFGPKNQTVGGVGLTGDFEATLPQDGQYLLVVGFGTSTNAAPYSIRVVTPSDTTNGLTIGAIKSGIIGEPGQADYYSFTGIAGQRLYLDSLKTDFYSIAAQLISPSGSSIFAHVTYSDLGPFTLTESGTYLLRIYHSVNFGDFPGEYRFRLLDVATAPLLAYDTVISDSITEPYGAALYRVSALSQLRLYLDQLIAPNSPGSYALYDPNNGSFGSVGLGNDWEITPVLNGTYALVLSSATTNRVPYIFQIVPGNHPPDLLAISNKVVDAGITVDFLARATDLEVPNDVLTWSLKEGPMGAILDSSTGLFTWTPSQTNAPSINTVTVCVRDDGVPSFEDCLTFTITVNDVFHPVLATPVIAGTNVILTWNALNNGNYRVQYKRDLNQANWTDLGGDVTAVGTNATKIDTLTISNRFYRVQVLP